MREEKRRSKRRIRMTGGRRVGRQGDRGISWWLYIRRWSGGGGV